MPDSAPQSQEQPPQVPRPPQNSAVVQNFVAPEVPTQDTPKKIEVVLVVLLSCLYICVLSRGSYPRGVYSVRRPLCSFGILRLVYSILYV